MKKSIFIFLVLFLFFLNGCKSEEGLPPTFQGLVISGVADPDAAPGKQTKPESPAWEAIEEAIASESELGGSAACDFYAQPNQTLYLLIKIYNPEEFDLLSCVVNGVRHHSYQFLKSSDYGNIVLEFNAGSAAGRKELELTAIQYSDGRKIRELKILENNRASYAVSEQKLPSVEISALSVTATSAEFRLLVRDPEAVVEKNGGNLKMFLFDGKEIVGRKELEPGDNVIKFMGLEASALYEFAVAAVCDLYDGAGKRLLIFCKDNFRSEEIIAIANPESGADYIAFELIVNDKENEGSIQAIELLQNGKLAASLDKDGRFFSGLASGTEYLLKVTYGYGKRFAVEEMLIKTSKKRPEVEIKISETGKRSFRYALEITDPDSVCRITKIELYLDGILQEEKSPETEAFFTELLSGKEYFLKAEYVFDLEDGLGERTESVSVPVETQALEAPRIAIENFVAGYSHFDFEIEVHDPDGTGELASVALHEGEELVFEEREISTALSFSGLKANTLYGITVFYEYDLNDGHGLRELRFVSERATLPLPVAVRDLVFLVPDLPRVGEEIHARIFFENPSRAAITSCVVNGAEVPVVLGKDGDTGIISIRPETEGGLYEVEISALKYDHCGEEVQQELSETFRSEIMILGELEVVRLYSEGGRIGVEDGDWLHLELKNETGYLVTEAVLDFSGETIVYGADEMEKLDDGLIALPWKAEISDYSEIYKKVSLVELTYGLAGGSARLAVSGVEAEIMFLRTLSPRTLHSHEDLLALEAGHHYRLAADIDLAQSVWEPRPFSGILDGGGHTLKNLSVVTGNGFAGLFSEFSGEIMNLELADFYIHASNAAAAGALCGRASRAKITDCNLYGTIIASGEGIAAGGAIGMAERAEIASCQIRVSLRVQSQEAALAGISGRALSVLLRGNLVSGSFSLSGSGVLDSFANSEETTAENNYLAHDALFEMNGNEKKFPGQSHAGLAELNETGFYLEVLGWSSDIWDFSLLDYERGLTPSFKK